MFDLIHEILQTLSHNKLRTALTGLSVAWGIFMLITLVSVANGVTRSFKNDMMGEDSQQMQMWGGQTTKPYNGYREGRKIDLKNSDLSIIERKHANVVTNVTSEITGSQSEISTNTTYINAGFTGVFPSKLALERLALSDGRFISQSDLDHQAKVMVLPEEYASQLFPPDGKAAVGSRVNCGGISFLVIGVYKSRWGRTNYIPYTTARVFAADKDNVGQLTVLLNGVTKVEDAENIEMGIRHTMAATHNFNPEDMSGVWIWNAISQSLKIQGAIGILDLSVWILGLLTLLSGIIGISNIMFVSVKERTHEIGIRRAIGAKPHKILIQILSESVAITTLFGYIGIIMGTALTELLTNMIQDSFMSYVKVDLALAAQVTVVLIIAGALAGLFPALKALKVKPVEALRDE